RPRSRQLRYSCRLIQFTLSSGPEPLHEAVADQRRIARRPVRARLVVDLGGQQNGTALLEAPVDQLLEVLLVGDPFAVDAGGARDPDDVGGALGRGRLLAGD